ncbi:hypothetical protein FA13DRAFT_1719797 [Coprinellus micaceus]|uniref:Uncharacterized protein n=1 Tax=Coprinellus micaceus TaxID=71717 RepID=A0A4Y7SAE2_COPMI|nr:hypothetical protein FA13DRAFT_1719797 [Coprinellus micaceus]
MSSSAKDAAAAEPSKDSTETEALTSKQSDASVKPADKPKNDEEPEEEGEEDQEESQDQDESEGQGPEEEEDDDRPRFEGSLFNVPLAVDREPNRHLQCKVEVEASGHDPLDPSGDARDDSPTPRESRAVKTRHVSTADCERRYPVYSGRAGVGASPVLDHWSPLSVYSIMIHGSHPDHASVRNTRNTVKGPASANPGTTSGSTTNPCTLPKEAGSPLPQASCFLPSTYHVLCTRYPVNAEKLVELIEGPRGNQDRRTWKRGEVEGCLDSGRSGM